MLLDRARRLTDRLGELEKLRQRESEAEALETRARQLSTAARGVRDASERQAQLKAAGLSVAFTPANGEDLLAKTRTLRSAVEQDAGAIVEPPFNLRYEFTDRLAGLASAADAAALQAWQSQVSRLANIASDEILSALAAVPEYRATVMRIRGLNQQIATLAATLPADPSVALKNLRTILTALREAWEGLSAGGIPQAVIAFLRACATEGAPLNLLTDEVREWLSARRLMHVFRVRIGTQR